MSSPLRRSLVRFLFVALCLLPLARLGAAHRIFLNAGGIPGDAVDKGFEGMIEIQAFSWGAVNASATANTARLSSKPEVADVVISKKFDVSSPTFMMKLLKGEAIPSMLLIVVKNDLKTGLVRLMEVELTNVFVSSLQQSDSAGGDPVPYESVSFNYQKIKLTHLGADGKKTSFEWSVPMSK